MTVHNGVSITSEAVPIEDSNGQSKGAPGLDPLSDLAAKALRGDEDARACLARRSRDRVFGWCRGLGLDREAAEDATQEVLVRVCQGLPGLQDPRAFPAWLYRIVINVGLRTSMKSAEGLRRSNPLSEDVPEPGTSHAELVATKMYVEWLLECVGPEDGRVLDMRFRQELSGKEISEQLGISDGAARFRVHAALRRLRELVRGEARGRRRKR